jgi:fumarylacetoacetase
MLRSFIDVAQDAHFPIQNLPYGVFRPRVGGPPRVGMAIGEHVLDLSALEAGGLLRGLAAEGRGTFAAPALNRLMALGRPAWRELRARITQLLSADEPALRDSQPLRDAALLPVAQVELLLPAAIGDYTDFYSSRHHAGNVGTMFRGGDNPLLPNWRHLPVGYHGRSSSIVLDGAPVRRPMGQRKPPDAPAPRFGPSQQLDFELELGFFVGPGNALGEPVPLERAEEQIFGLVLLNDWSARDIQAWEYQPLGPFLAKNFCTSISPWVVPLDALEPFRVAGEPQAPEPLPYLRQSGPAAFDLRLEVLLQTPALAAPATIAVSNARHLYWSMAQQLAHHTVGGCNLRPGDLLASGTISGPEREERGCLLELAWRGTEPVQLPGGEQRVWLEDGDTLTLTGWGQAEGYRVGFGAVSGTILPANSQARLADPEA